MSDVATLVAAGLAVVGTLGGTVVGTLVAPRIQAGRDLEQWRRAERLEALSSLLQASDQLAHAAWKIQRTHRPIGEEFEDPHRRLTQATTVIEIICPQQVTEPVRQLFLEWTKAAPRWRDPEDAAMPA